MRILLLLFPLCESSWATVEKNVDFRVKETNHCLVEYSTVSQHVLEVMIPVSITFLLLRKVSTSIQLYVHHFLVSVSHSKLCLNLTTFHPYFTLKRVFNRILQIRDSMIVHFLFRIKQCQLFLLTFLDTLNFFFMFLL